MSAFEDTDNKYLDEVAIDLNELEKECADQERRSWYWGKNYAKAVGVRDTAKSNLKVLSATIELEIRKTEPKKFGLEKYSEATIQALITIDPRTIKAEGELNKAQENLELLKVAKDGFASRGRQLTNLVWLGRELREDPEYKNIIREQLKSPKE